LQLGVDNFSPTIGWLTCWKNRNNIVFKKTCGEKKDVDFQAAEDYLKNCIASSIMHLMTYITQTKLVCIIELYQILLLIFKVNGCKKQMQRLTILLVCNMSDTDKRRPLIIG
jgi:hypothetical protein